MLPFEKVAALLPLSRTWWHEIKEESMSDEMVLPAAIVLAAFLIAVGLWAAGSAVGSGLRCQAVTHPTVGAARPTNC